MLLNKLCLDAAGNATGIIKAYAQLPTGDRLLFELGKERGKALHGIGVARGNGESPALKPAGHLFPPQDIFPRENPERCWPSSPSARARHRQGVEGQQPGDDVVSCGARGAIVTSHTGERQALSRCNPLFVFFSSGAALSKCTLFLSSRSWCTCVTFTETIVYWRVDASLPSPVAAAIFAWRRAFFVRFSRWSLMRRLRNEE